MDGDETTEFCSECGMTLDDCCDPPLCCDCVEAEDRCAYCGRTDVGFEDGLRCKVCAEDQEAK